MHVIKVLLGSVREYKKESLLSPLFIVLEVIMECIIPFIVAQFINTLQNFTSEGANSEELMNKIIVYGILLLIMAFSSLFCGIMAAKMASKASGGFAKNLRHDLYYKVQDYSFANIDKFSAPSLVTRMTTDVANVRQAYMMIIRVAIRSPLLLIFSMTISFSYHSTLPLIFLIILPILAGGLYLIFIKAHPLFKKVFKKYDNLNNTVQENIRGMRVVKSYVREEYEKEKFDNANSEVANDFTRAEKIMSMNNPLMVFAMYACMILISFFGAKIIIESGASELNIGDLTSLTTYTMQMLSSLMMFSFVFLMVAISTESANRIVEVLDEEPTIVNPENPIYEVKNGEIVFKDVSFKYARSAQKYALSDIDLTIKSGETVGILGGTGSSKSTLIQLISRLYDASEGEVLVGGENVKNYDLTSLRNQVSVVLQKNILFSGTIKENLRWGNKDASDEEIIDACKLAQAHEFVSQFTNGYDTYIEQGGTNVSGGQRQRLCIARALLKHPKVLILDDSTSAVDTKTDALIRKGLKEYLPETTKIIIAQRVASIKDADKIIIMENGTINAIGTHTELLKSNEIYKEVYYSQNTKKKKGSDVNE